MQTAKTSLRLLLVTGLASSSFATAQQPPQTPTPPSIRQGMASAWAAGVSLRTETPGESILYKNRGNQANRPIAWPANLLDEPADYSLNMLAPGHPLNVPDVTPIDIDAMTSARSVIPQVNPNTGIPILSLTNQWLALSVSIRARPAIGAPLPFRSNHGRSVGSDIVTYYQDPTGAIDANLDNAVVLEARSDAFGLGFAPAAGDDIDALDWSMGVMLNNRAAPSRILFRNNEVDLYFSVTPEWCANNSTLAFAHHPNQPTMVPPRPGDVYHMTWTSGIGWGIPDVHVAAEDLTDDPNGYSGNLAMSLDIDALDYDVGHQVMIFSATVESAMPSQLMVCKPMNNGGLSMQPMPLKNEAGNEVGDILDIGDNEEELDGLCGFDPESDDRVPAVALSCPVSVLWPFGGEPSVFSDNTVRMGLSVIRQEAANSTVLPDALSVVLTGYGAVPTNRNVKTDVTVWVIERELQTGGYVPTGMYPITAPQARSKFEDSFSIDIPQFWDVGRKLAPNGGELEYFFFATCEPKPDTTCSPPCPPPIALRAFTDLLRMKG